MHSGRRGLPETIDLCDSPGALQQQPAQQMPAKRRRLGGGRGQLSAAPIELSDGDSDDDLTLARRLQEEERTLASRIAQRSLSSDQELARRLQEEERQARLFPHPLSRYGAGLPRGYPGASADLHGAMPRRSERMFDMFGDDDAWRSEPPLLPALVPPAWHPLNVGALGVGGAGRGLSGLFDGRRSNHLAHLSLMDRDFGEADYEMLLQLDKAEG